MNKTKKLKKIDKVSSSFCLAKWLQVTVDLVHGTNHSCHHPKRHAIPLSEIEEKGPWALHNTDFKMEQRKKMLRGERPPECEYCWNIEDTPGQHYSDRHIKSLDDWAYPHLDGVLKDPLNIKTIPTYLEVMLTKKCNFSCIYCMAHISSSIEQEITKFGPYPVSNPTHRAAEFPTVDSSPYIKAFRQWIPIILPHLKVLRVTGGEPLMDQETFDFLQTLLDSPKVPELPQLTLAINTNLGVNEPRLLKFMSLCERLLQEKKLKNIDFYISIDSWKKQAEYIRFGLNYDFFMTMLQKLIKKFPSSKIILMTAYNILSVPQYHDFLETVLTLKKNFRNIILDISLLKNPSYLSVALINNKLTKLIGLQVLFMENHSSKNYEEGFSAEEINKMKRIYHYAMENIPAHQLGLGRSDFYAFINEFDRRKGLNFLEVFPELSEFWKVCQKTNQLHLLEIPKDKNIEHTTTRY